MIQNESDVGTIFSWQYTSVWNIPNYFDEVENAWNFEYAQTGFSMKKSAKSETYLLQANKHNVLNNIKLLLPIFYVLTQTCILLVQYFIIPNLYLCLFDT